MSIDQDITNLPTPPSRSDSPSDFSDKADTFLAALPQLQTELNLYADEANSTQTEINLSETNAATSEQNAEDWAVDLSGLVLSTDYSAKAYAISTDLIPEGAAKEWSLKTDGSVDTTEYSAKAYAVSEDLVPDGSAKEWAIKLGSEVDGNDFSAKKYAIDAQAAADTAQVTANASPWESTTTYNTGDVVIGSDANTYRSLIDGNLNNNPVLGDGTNWKNLTAAALVTKAELTKSFTSGEEVTLSLEEEVTTAPVVSVTKEVPQTNITNNDWDVAADGSNFELHDTAYSTTLTPSTTTGEGTFTLGTGSFAAEDVGKKIVGNGGVAYLTATDGSYTVETDFTDTSTIAAGDWSMFALDVESAAAGLGLSSVVSGGYSLDNAFYSGNSHSVSSEESSLMDIFFKPEGDKMFVAGAASDSVFEYNLSSAWDISSVSYSGSSFSTLSEARPRAIFFKPDGTRLFSAGADAVVYEYILSTPWSISSASYSNNSFDFSSQASDNRGLSFKSDGTKMFILSKNDEVLEYNLSTAWDITSASYSSNALDTSNPNDGGKIAMFFNPDGTLLYLAAGSSNLVEEVVLSTEWDISTATFSGKSFEASQAFSPEGLFFKPDGTKMFIGSAGADEVLEYITESFAFPTSANHTAITNASGQINTEFWVDINNMTADDAANDGSIYYAVSTDDQQTFSIVKSGEGVRNIARNNGGTWEVNDAADFATETWVAATENDKFYALEEAVDIDTAQSVTENPYYFENLTYENKSFNVSSEEGETKSIFFKSDGSIMYVVGYSNNTIFEYSLATPWDVSTASYTGVSFAIVGVNFTNGLFFRDDGSRMYVGNITDSEIKQYDLSVSWDITTAGLTAIESISNGNVSGIFFKPDGSKLFVLSEDNDFVKTYELSTPWDISTKSFQSNFTVGFNLAEGISFNDDGTVMYIASSDNPKSIFSYNLSIAWDPSSASLGLEKDISSTVDKPQSLFIGDGGKRLYTNDTDEEVYQFTIIDEEPFSTNRMDGTQLAAASDAEYFTLGDTFDLAVTLTMPDSGSTSPTSDGVSINYDAQAKNQGAILGTDYEWDRPAADTVNFKALSNENFKIRVV